MKRTIFLIGLLILGAWLAPPAEAGPQGPYCEWYCFGIYDDDVWSCEANYHMHGHWPLYVQCVQQAEAELNDCLSQTSCNASLDGFSIGNATFVLAGGVIEDKETQCVGDCMAGGGSAGACADYCRSEHGGGGFC